MPVCIYVHICLSLISVYICLVTYIYIYEKIWPKGLKLIAENKPSEQGKTKLQKAPSCNQEQKQWTCRCACRLSPSPHTEGKAMGFVGSRPHIHTHTLNCRSWSHPCRGFPPFIWAIIHLPGHTVPGLCLNKARTVPVFSHHAAGRRTELGTCAKVFKGCPET